jgi:predicted MFS family arabinose efflux permease
MTQTHRYRRYGGSALLTAFGVVMLVTSIAAHHLEDGVWALAISLVVAAGFAVGGRSELIRAIRGDGDERAAHVTAVTNGVVLNLAALAAVAGSVVEQARGIHSGPWTLACVAGGCLYLVVFLVVRARG